MIVVDDQSGGATGPCAVIALTGSAGALEEIFDVLTPLPVDFAGAVVVLLHQMPDRTGHLDDVIGRRCRLRVRYAAQNEQLSPGRVVVIPPGRHMVVAPGGNARLVTSGAFPPNRPSADLLLSTMAVSLGDRAIAVVLSGCGRDAATGATVVHDFGGIVIAADPEFTQFVGMPMETIERDEAVDYVLPARDIGPLLAKLTNSP